MPITGVDVTAPVGALTTDLLAALVTTVAGAATAADVADAYADAGNARTAAWADASRARRGAVAWAQYRALTDRAQQILTAPSSASADGEGSVGYSSSQAELLIKAAEAQLAAFLVEEQAELAPDDGRPLPRVSRSVRVRTEY